MYNPDSSVETRSRFKTEELKPVVMEQLIKPVLPHIIKPENKEITESDLFTIPEIEASSPQETLQSKKQISHREGCVQVPSDYSHDRDSDKEQTSDEENGKLDKTNSAGSKPKRSTSIPSGIRRNSSYEEEKKEVRVF